MTSKANTINSKPLSMLADSMEAAAESFDKATSNAPESARRTAKTAMRSIGNGLYNSFYGLSYGVVFSAVFLTELLPEAHSIRRALVEGAEAALEERRKIQSELKKIESVKTAQKKSLRTKPSKRVRKVVNALADRFEKATT